MESLGMKKHDLSSIETFSWAPHEDSRGAWQRVWDSQVISGFGHNPQISQISLSRNPTRHTLRGLHSLDTAIQEYKTVICISGAVQDVIVDVRPDSETFAKWRSFNLISKPAQGILIPPGFAHGFLTLEPETNLLYIMSKPYDEFYERSFRWDDPRFKIPWAAEPVMISIKDKTHPFLPEGI